MAKLTDLEICQWIKADERFEGRSDGGGLYLRYRLGDKSPRWLFRYQLGGRSRALHLGSYRDLSLGDARKEAKQQKARVTLGHDVAAEKRDRVVAAVAKIDAERNAMTVGKLADEYFAERVVGRWKHPNIVRSRIERDIKPAIGKLALGDVKPSHIDGLLKRIVKRGAPTMATDVLRWLKRMFNYAVKREMMSNNPAAAFDPTDAGGEEVARDRALSRSDLARLFSAMRGARGWTHENTLTVKLLLMLAVRKSELICARKAEFDLDGAVWYLPADRTKTGAALDIPLPFQAVEYLRELDRLAAASAWLLPARRMQSRMVPHIDPNTVNAALAKSVKPLMQGCEPFTLHDFRRTARTHLSELGVSLFVAERCLNHKIKGIVGIYDRHHYFEERKAALQAWADVLTSLEVGDAANAVPIRKAV